MSFGPNPWQQTHWDWRAAGNFIGGGAGGGLIVFAALVRRARHVAGLLLLGGVALVGAGLFCVWLEIGRPLRALNVSSSIRAVVDVARGVRRHAADAGRRWPRRSGLPGMRWLAGGARAGVRLLPSRACCTGRKGIPAWREPLIVPLIVLTGLTEGAGLVLAAAAGTAFAEPRCCWRWSARWCSPVCAGLAGPIAALAHARARALRRARRRRSRCCRSPDAVPLVLVALALRGHRSPAALAADRLQRWAGCWPPTGACLKFTLDHARRLQPGLRAGAPAGARRAPLSGISRQGGFDMGAIDEWPRSAHRARRQCLHRGAGNHAARAARGAAARAACAATRAQRLRPRAAASRAARRGRHRARTTSARWPTCGACRSPSSPTCATTIRSACSRGRSGQLARLHASSGTTGKPTVVGYTRARHRRPGPT